jgi:hypothetical protein
MAIAINASVNSGWLTKKKSRPRSLPPPWPFQELPPPQDPPLELPLRWLDEDEEELWEGLEE